MNPRERNLSIILGTVLGGGALMLGVYFWFWTPLSQHKMAIAALNDDLQKKQDEITAFQKDRRKLVLARAKSLPPNAAEATTEYQLYLQHVMTMSGLTVEDISPSQASKMKFQPSVPGIKEVGHQMMTYTVRARGTLGQMVAAMEQMQSTPYEHRIRNLTVDRAEMRDNTVANPKLNINMVIETLLVAKSDSKTGLPPGFEAKGVILDTLASQFGSPNGLFMLGSFVTVKASMPVPDSRSYYRIAEKNIFGGPQATIKVTKPPVVVTPPTTKVETVDPISVLVGPDAPKYTFLTHTDPEQQTAYWRNRVSRSREQKLIAKPNSGYETFTLKDDQSDFVFLNAKVIRVDLRIVYFQKGKTMYAWHIGTSLEEALQNDLDLDQRDLLDLQIDQVYAKESTADPKDKTSKKQPTSKTKTKGKGL